MVEDAIHNPNEPRHFMRVVPVDHLVTATIGEHEVARSRRAVKVKEVGFDIYDPVIYFPREDVTMELLTGTDKTTHCPLKGDTQYLDARIDDQVTADAAWSYVSTLDIAAELRQLVAFDAAQVHVAEHRNISP